MSFSMSDLSNLISFHSSYQNDHKFKNNKGDSMPNAFEWITNGFIANLFLR